ncbi:hypothetical protein ACH5RR_009949 [Cinchona calisaya]|uniref:Uncharacterized protein n=1 Tax=Cinchona calisaya TaxID=153742 RepID=A0ABD3AI64_9GENT
MLTGISIAGGGLVSKLIVYLIQEFNIKSITAAKIFNVVNGCVFIIPLAGAIIADSYMDCYSVISISSLISSLGMLLLSLTAAFSKLRPTHCKSGSNLCKNPSEVQISVLYIGLALATLGTAGARFTAGSLGAKQFDKPKHQGIFFSWFIFVMFLNRAALKAEGDTEQDDSIRKPWRLCTALTMDRHLGAHFKIPAGTMPIFIYIATCTTIFLLDRFLFPMWENLTRRPITPLQRVGIGHVFDVLSMAVLALIEAKRLNIVRQNNLQDQDNAVVPMSVFWLVPSLVLAGIGEAFHFHGHITFYYQEFPASLKHTSTAVVSLSIGIGFYMGNGLIDVVRKSTKWLPDNINRGKLDNVYWLVSILGGINFCYYLVCASMYKYQNIQKVTDDCIDKDQDALPAF